MISFGKENKGEQANKKRVQCSTSCTQQVCRHSSLCKPQRIVNKQTVISTGPRTGKRLQAWFGAGSAANGEQIRGCQWVGCVSGCREEPRAQNRFTPFFRPSFFHLGRPRNSSLDILKYFLNSSSDRCSSREEGSTGMLAHSSALPLRSS